METFKYKEEQQKNLQKKKNRTNKPKKWKLKWKTKPLI